MKTLTKVKLINWHTFSNEEFEIYKNALITGENGTGKSTILDAIQYVLTAGKCKFNKAASDIGNRTLESYIRCKTGIEGHEYARNGENVKIEPRQIEIYSLELLNVDNINKTIHFKVECSKGTYIRTLCEGIAERLGTVGYMKELNRTRVGDFYIENSITIEQLEQSQYQIITIEQFFKDEEFINLTEKGLKLFLNGVQLTYHLVDGIYRIYQDDKFIGIGTIKNELLKRDIII